MGKAQEQNTGKGSGNRVADGAKVAGASNGQLDKGDGATIKLPARQMEMFKQALNGQLPPEYSAIIGQYLKNVADKKPATAPTTPSGGGGR